MAAGSLVTLDGSSNQGAQTYLWTITSAPAGSTASLSDPTAASPTFLADVAGTYELSLVCTFQRPFHQDAVFTSDPGTVKVTAASALVEAIIPVTGGRLEWADSNGRVIAALTVPAGALDNETTLTVRSTTASFNGIKFFDGTVFEFAPDGLAFNVPAELEIVYDPAVLGTTQESTLGLYRISNGVLSELPSTVDAVAHTVTAEVSGFSTFGVGAEAVAPVTTATPPGFNYPSLELPTVTLSCTDEGGSGCRATYYTLDGSDPTTSSTVYSDPFEISETSTLKFFSTDFAGNSEDIQSELYTIIQTFRVGGTVSVTGAAFTNRLWLDLNGVARWDVTGPGSFAFPTVHTSGFEYTVTVETAPPGKSCEVTNGTGTVADADVTDILVICQDIAVNSPPVANAGANQNVATGSVVTLNGTGSSDADSDPLTYAWTLTRPAGSTAALGDATAATPSFTADVDGTYTASLVVNDGTEDSTPDSVSVTATAANAAPVANAGADRDVVTGSVVTLDGTGSSDANSDPLTYAWTLTRPAGSTAALDDATAATPSFTADVDGTYTASLVVNDGTVDSALDSVTVTASAIPMPPDPPQNLTAITGDGTVTLAWDAVGDADSYTVYWSTAGFVSTLDTNETVLSNQFVHTGLTSGTTYYYGVSATNGNGESFLSDELRVTQRTDWLWMHPLPSGLDFKGLAGCNDIFVGVTAAGGIFTSTDSGLNWAEGNSGTLDDFASVACDGSRFVAAGRRGLLVTSQDGGATWLKLAGNFIDITKVIWAGGQFVGVGSRIVTSPNGIGWAAQTPFINGLKTVAWNGSQYVAYKESFTANDNATYTSPDGTTWTEHSTPLDKIQEIVWNGTEFVAIPPNAFQPGGSNVSTSPDGVNWTDTGAMPSANLLNGSIIWDGSQFVGTGQNGLIATSADGITWSSKSTPTNKQLNALGTNGVTYLAGGYGGTVLSSTTLSSWSLQLPEAPLTQDLLNDILWDGSRFIAVGGNFGPDVILTSPNGVAWAASDNGAGSGGLKSIAYNGSSTYVAVGVSGRILTSPDGMNWTSRTSGVTSGNLNKVIWADTQFVAVGGYKEIVTSPDGETWTVRSSGTFAAGDPRLSSVAWDGTTLVAVGSSGSTHKILTSQDGGVTWTESFSAFSRLDDVIWVNGEFLVVGESTHTYTSTDGLDWTDNSPTGLVFGYLPFVEWDGTQFVSSITNTIYTSVDGVTWDAIENTGLSENKIGFEAMAWGDSGQAVGVGIEGMILMIPSW